MEGVRNNFCAFFQFFLKFFLILCESIWQHVANNHVGVFEIVLEETGADHGAFPAEKFLAEFGEEVDEGVDFEACGFGAVVFCGKMNEAAVAGADVVNALSFADFGVFKDVMDGFHGGGDEGAAAENGDAERGDQKDDYTNDDNYCDDAEDHEEYKRTYAADLNLSVVCSSISDFALRRAATRL